jgi:single-strand DNA-binding protein
MPPEDEDVSGELPEPGHLNTVVLRGRLAAPAQERELPSGDLLAAFRLIVDRPRPRRPGTPTVDTLDCVAWRPRLRRVVGAWRAGDVVEVRGALRRRFWRGPAGPASRCEIEVSGGRRVTKAPP